MSCELGQNLLQVFHNQSEYALGAISQLPCHIVGCVESNIRMVADGSCAYTQAFNMVKDATGSGMGLRSMRYAAIIERGKVKALQIDEKGMVNSSAESILKLL